MARPRPGGGFDTLFAIVNDAAIAYKGVITAGDDHGRGQSATVASAVEGRMMRPRMGVL